MKYNIYLFNFNNYYNRIVKKFGTLEEYRSPVLSLANANFNPADGIHTEHIFNAGELQSYKISPDYCVVTDLQGNIVFRWYVIENGYTRLGQYRVQLYRDVLADGYDQVIGAPCFIEKATLPYNDPMIFNSENMTYNQIKSGETPLKDETKTPWIVGYWTNKTDEGDKTAESIGTVGADYTVTDLSQYTYYNYKDTVKQCSPKNLTYNIWVERSGIFYSSLWYSFLFGSDFITAGTSETSHSTRYRVANGHLNLTAREIKEHSAQYFYNAYDSAYDEIFSQMGWLDNETVNTLKAENNKVIFNSTNSKYYKINVSVAVARTLNVSIDPTSSVGVAITNEIIGDNTYIYVDPSGPHAGITANCQISELLLKIEEFFTDTTTSKIPTTRQHTQDQPYDIFCIPFPEIDKTLSIKKNSSSINASRESAFNAAIALSREYGGTSPLLYDLQLLPYCPVRNFIDSDGNIDVTTGTENVDYSWIIDGSNNRKNIIIFARQSNFTFDITHEIQIENYKVESECDKYRLVSPNYNGQFDFNAAKNGGVNRFNVDCTYKPYTPYIHINPDFGRLYGTDYDDCRGLICGGDFSLPMISEKWAEYELTHKNYQVAFDRQIEDMEIKNKYQRVADITNAITGTVTGAVEGAIAGNAVGNAVGGVIGGIAGGVASAAGGIADIYINEQLRNEALDYTKDQFGYELGNIQALPYSLTKVGAFIRNNKLFPILEYYTCTDEEKTALENKLRYDGMTVMRIGTIREFLQADYSYVKARLIRLDSLNEDFHFLKVIASELYKGVFIK